MTERLSFSDVQKCVRSIAERITQDHFSPKFLVGVARGGWIPVRLLSSALGVKQILSIGITYADAQRTKLTTYSLPEPFPQGENVLIMEDCLESGRSLEFSKEVFASKKNTVRTAALFITDKSVFVPDYYLSKYPKPPLFPWE